MKVVKWGVHGTGTCIGPGILLRDLKYGSKNQKQLIPTEKKKNDKSGT